MKTLFTILFGADWSLKKMLSAIMAGIGIICIFGESDNIFWLIATKLFGIASIWMYIKQYGDERE